MSNYDVQGVITAGKDSNPLGQCSDGHITRRGMALNRSDAVIEPQHHSNYTARGSVPGKTGDDEYSANLGSFPSPEHRYDWVVWQASLRPSLRSSHAYCGTQTTPGKWQVALVT